jgi:hypothetical protein
MAFALRLDHGLTSSKVEGLAIAPGQKHGILFGHAPTDKRTHVFVVRRRLKMDGSNLRPSKVPL